jgi:hypothetical protein
MKRKRNTLVLSSRREDVNLEGANAEVACWAGWLKKGGRRWAAAGLEKEGGGQAETISWAKIK